jgi:hypothetical protein
MVDVHLADGTTITATDRHPFWDATTGKFTYALDLRPGDMVRRIDGTLLAVAGIRVYDRDVTAYNLTVDGIHTYYAGTTPVLVHNSCYNPANLGESYGGRVVVDDPGISITGFKGSANPLDPYHGLNRVIERGVSPSDILSTMRSPAAVLEQPNGRFMYLSDRAAMVVRPDGQVVTGFSANEFNATTQQILRDALGLP